MNAIIFVIMLCAVTHGISNIENLNAEAKPSEVSKHMALKTVKTRGILKALQVQVGARGIDENSGRSSVLKARQEIVMYTPEAYEDWCRRLEHAWPRLSADIVLFGRPASETPKHCLFLSQSSVIEHAPSSLG
jgi:hypothetical protein